MIAGMVHLGRLILFVLLLNACAFENRHTDAAEPSPMLDPLTIARTGNPNDALICPVDRCKAEPDATAPDYDVSPEMLFEAWLEVVGNEPRTTIIGKNTETFLVNAEQRSRIFGFVDTIAARVIPLGDTSATIAIYSRSNVGYWDIGVNKSRVERWLNALNQSIVTD